MKYFTPIFLVVSIILSTSATGSASDVGKRFPSEKKIWTDPVTKNELTVLTSSTFNDVKPYQTHDTWTTDGKWIVFRSNRNGRNYQIFAVNEESGEIVQLTDDPTVRAETTNLSRKEMKLFFMRGGASVLPAGTTDDDSKHPPRQVVELDLGRLFADSAAGSLKPPAEYERVTATLPLRVESHGFALDADESRLYWGVFLGRDKPVPTQKQLEEERKISAAEAGKLRSQIFGSGKSVLYSIDVKTGELKEVVKMDFRIGHVQANPWVPGEVFFCHETVGDAPQRIWSVRFDGSEHRPIYVETPDEWVTHEVVSGRDEMMFIISGHQPRLREKPSGVAVINLRNRQMLLLGQTEQERGGVWHCNGTPDGRWAVVDTFPGSIYLIDRTTGQRTLLTAKHPMKPDHMHPIFSPDGKRVLIQSGILKDGKMLDLMTVATP